MNDPQETAQPSGFAPTCPEARPETTQSDPRKWTCSTCSMVAHFAAGFDVPADLPIGWQREPGGGLTCPRCDLDRVERNARNAARAELTRDPEATDREIADRVGAAGHPMIRVRGVTTVRRELVVEGVILSARARARERRKAERRAAVQQAKAPRPTPKPMASRPKAEPPARPPLVERYPEIAAELRRDPRRSNMDIARRHGLTNEATTRRVRWALEAQGEIEVYRGNGRTA